MIYQTDIRQQHYTVLAQRRMARMRSAGRTERSNFQLRSVPGTGNIPPANNSRTTTISHLVPCSHLPFDCQKFISRTNSHMAIFFGCQLSYSHTKTNTKTKPNLSSYCINPVGLRQPIWSLPSPFRI